MLPLKLVGPLMGRRSVMPVALLLLFVAALLTQYPAAAAPQAQAPAASAPSALDYEFFKTKVQPIFLAKRDGHTRCVSCHSKGTPMRLQALSPGAATWNESMKALKPGGQLVTCGATTGPQANIDLRFLFARQLAVLGSYMGTMSDLHEVLRHVFSGKLKPVVDRTFPLQQIRAAHEYLENSQMFGKVVVNP